MAHARDKDGSACAIVYQLFGQSLPCCSLVLPAYVHMDNAQGGRHDGGHTWMNGSCFGCLAVPALLLLLLLVSLSSKPLPSLSRVISSLLLFACGMLALHVAYKRTGLSAAGWA